MVKTFKGTKQANIGEACMVHKSIETSKVRAKQIAKAWAAQEGCYHVEYSEFARGYGAVIRAYLEMPHGPLPDACYVGML